MSGNVEQSLKQAKRLIASGAKAKAAELCLEVLVRFPGNRQARARLAEATKLAGEERSGYERRMAATKALLRQGASEAALAEAHSLLAEAPQIHTFHTLTAEVLVALENRETAAAHLMTAYKLAPGNVDVALNLARLLIDLGRPSEVVSLSDEVLSKQPTHLLALALRGKALAMLGESAQAIVCFDKLLEAEPDRAEAYADRSSARFSLGQTDAAKADILEAISRDPGNTYYRYLYCLAGGLADDDPIVASSEARLHRGDLSPQDEVFLSFGLAKVRHDRKDPAGAFALWKRGNSLKKSDIGYDLGQDQAEFDRAKRMAEQGLPHITPKPLQTRCPVFIIGLPRSGTSLVEQILASHPQVFGAGERDALARSIRTFSPEWQPDGSALAKIRETYASDIAATTPARRYVTDKMPSNFLYIPYIVAAFPEARIIHLTRDPMAVLWSNYRHFFPQGGRGTGFGHDLEDLAGYYHLYRDLIDGWNSRYPGRILTIDYESLCADQRAETARLLDHLDLEWHEGCMRFYETERSVTTVSTDQVRRPLYQGSSESWRIYEAYLEPLKQALGQKPANAS